MEKNPPKEKSVYDGHALEDKAIIFLIRQPYLLGKGICKLSKYLFDASLKGAQQASQERKARRLQIEKEQERFNQEQAELLKKIFEYRCLLEKQERERQGHIGLKQLSIIYGEKRVNELLKQIQEWDKHE